MAGLSDKTHETQPAQSGFELLVREHIGWMLALSERLSNDRELARDAVQDAFVSAFKSLPAFEGRANIRTWLHRITVNATLAQLRRKTRRAEQSIEELQPDFDATGCRVEPSWSTLPDVESILQSEQYIGLEPGGDEKLLAHQSEISHTQSAMVLEQIIGQFLFSKASESKDDAPF